MWIGAEGGERLREEHARVTPGKRSNRRWRSERSPVEIITLERSEYEVAPAEQPLMGGAAAAVLWRAGIV